MSIRLLSVLKGLKLNFSFHLFCLEVVTVSVGNNTYGWRVVPAIFKLLDCSSFGQLIIKCHFQLKKDFFSSLLSFGGLPIGGEFVCSVSLGRFHRVVSVSI